MGGSSSLAVVQNTRDSKHHVIRDKLFGAGRVSRSGAHRSQIAGDHAGILGTVPTKIVGQISTPFVPNGDPTTLNSRPEAGPAAQRQSAAYDRTFEDFLMSAMQPRGLMRGILQRGPGY